MNNQNETNHNIIDHNIIESLVSLMDISRKGNTEFERLPETCHASGLHSLMEVQGIQSAYYLKEFADGMPGGFFIYRAYGNEEIIYANNAMLQIFNCDTMEEFKKLTGNSFRGIVHPDDLEAVEKSIFEQIATNKDNLDYVEYRIIQKGGEIRWLEDYGHFIHSKAAGDIFYVFVSDATEKKKRQEKEHNKELTLIHHEQLRSLEVIEGLSIDYESIFYVDLDENWIKAYRVGSRFKNLFPKEQHEREFLGFDREYIDTWVHPNDRKLLLGICTPEYIRARLSENKSFHLNYRIITDEKTIYKQLRIVDVGFESHISQIVMGYRSIDDEIIQEMKQNQMLKEALFTANQANNAKNLFLSNMSHDIRTPMNAIVGFADLAKKHIKDSTKLSGYLDMITSSSDQLLQLLNDMLQISKMKSSRVQMHNCNCHLSDIVNQVQTDLLPQAKDKGISLSFDSSNLKHDDICADHQKLNLVLFYLTDNAVKYTKTGGDVMVTVTEKEELDSGRSVYQFIVEDTGLGISKEFLENIYEPFEREKNTTLSGIHGIGLGLTITKELVEMMGGTIHISSTLGKGSKFTATIPLLLQEQQPEISKPIKKCLRHFNSPAPHS